MDSERKVVFKGMGTGNKIVLFMGVAMDETAWCRAFTRSDFQELRGTSMGDPNRGLRECH